MASLQGLLHHNQWHFATFPPQVSAHCGSSVVQNRHLVKWATRQQVRPRFMPRVTNLYGGIGKSNKNQEQAGIKRLHFMRISSKTCFVLPQAMTAEGGTSSPVKYDAQYFQGKVLKLWEMTPPPLQKFPWVKAYDRLVQRLKDLLWTAVKWVTIPALVISAFSEIIYSLTVNKEFLIPFGLLAGATLAGIMKETAIELSEEFQNGGFPWHLVVIGVFFSLIKISGPFLPLRAAAFLPHLANGGFLQIFRFVLEWRKTGVEKPAAGTISTEAKRT